MIRLPLKAGGTMISRRYHRYSPLLIPRFTPESAVSGENGTMICPSNSLGKRVESFMA